MKRMKSLLVVLIAVSMFMSIIGCSGSKEPVKETANATAVPPKTPEKVDAPFTVPAKFDNLTVKVITAWDDTAIKNAFEVTDAEVQKKYGIKVEYIQTPYNDIIPKLSALVMSGDSPDIFTGGLNYHPANTAKDIFEPIDAHVNFNDKVWAKYKDAMDTVMWNGKHYMLADNIEKPYYIIFNKKIFEENGLETPYELYKKGKWDWNAFLNAAGKLTLKNSDGSIAVYGFGGSPDQLVNTTGKALVSMTKEGKISNNLKDPDIARGFGLVTELGSKLNAMTPGWSDADKIFAEGKVAMAINGDWKLEDQKYVGDYLKNGKVGIVPFPKDPKADKNYVWGRPAGYFLAKGGKNPKGAAVWFATRLVLNENPEIQKKELDRKKGLGFTPEIFEMLTENQKLPMVVEYYRSMNSKFDIWGLMGDLKKAIPYETAIEKQYPKMEDGIKQLMEGAK